MENSLVAGPSIGTSTVNGASENEKRKRTRRRIRRSKNKIVPSSSAPKSRIFFNNVLQKNPQQEQENIHFVIGSVGKSYGKLFRQRDPDRGPIHLNSFIKTPKVPCVFQTGINNDFFDVESAILERFSKLSVQPVNEKADNKHDKSVNKRKTEKKKQNNKVFKDYLSFDEVEKGLENKVLVKGYIRINPKNPKDAYVGNEDKTLYDYVISSVLDRNRALDGDEVVLSFKPNSDDQKKTMEVVYITQKVRKIIINLCVFQKSRPLQKINLFYL